MGKAGAGKGVFARVTQHAERTQGRFKTCAAWQYNRSPKVAHTREPAGVDSSHKTAHPGQKTQEARNSQRKLGETKSIETDQTLQKDKKPQPKTPHTGDIKLLLGDNVRVEQEVLDLRDARDLEPERPRGLVPSNGLIPALCVRGEETAALGARVVHGLDERLPHALPGVVVRADNGEARPPVHLCV